MRKYLLLSAAALIAVAIVVIFLRPATTPGDKPPLAGTMAEFQLAARPAAEMKFSTGEGAAVSLKDFAGKVVLLNLWATWCAPCVREMPTLDRLQASLGGPSFEVVALSSDRAGTTVVRPFYEHHKLNQLRIYVDPKGEATRAVAARGLPTTVLIDKTGREVGRLEGVAEWDSPEALALMRYFIDQ